MSQENKLDPNDEIRAEYDFSNGVRSKYYQEYARGTNVVLEADVAEVFRDSDSVNQALRALITIARKEVLRS